MARVVRPSEIAWARYQETCRQGDKLRMMTVIVLGCAMILPVAAILIASIWR